MQFSNILLFTFSIVVSVFAAPAPAQINLPFAQSKPAQSKPAQSKPAKAAPPASKPAERIAPTFESLHIQADELPKGWKLDSKLECVSIQPATLMEPDAYKGLLPETLHKDFQTVVGAKAKGSILYLDWGAKIPGTVGAFLPSLLFGEEIKSTREHPEKLVVSGGTLIIVSFPLGSEERHWAIERLGRRFGLRIPQDLEELRPAVSTLARHEQNQEWEAGLKFAASHEKELLNVSFAAYLEGEMCTRAKSWVRGEKAYTRALTLDMNSDPLPTTGVVWAARDGLGTTLYWQKKYADAARELTLAAKLAEELKMPKQQAQTLYNCACCLALSGKVEDAIATLRKCLELAPERKAEAAKDEDFNTIKARPDFLALLK